MQYSNTCYQLLGEIAGKVGGAPIGTLIEREIIAPLGLAHTTYQSDRATGLAHGYTEFNGQVLDMADMTQDAFLSFGGAAAEIHTDAGGLLTFAHAMLAGADGSRLLHADSLRSLMVPTAGSRHAVGLMGFCPCPGSGGSAAFAGWGHTGFLPGYLSALAYFPATDVTVVVFVNRDQVDGRMLDSVAVDDTVAEVVKALGA